MATSKGFETQYSIYPTARLRLINLVFLLHAFHCLVPSRLNTWAPFSFCHLSVRPSVRSQGLAEERWDLSWDALWQALLFLSPCAASMISMAAHGIRLICQQDGCRKDSATSPNQYNMQKTLLYLPLSLFIPSFIHHLYLVQKIMASQIYSRMALNFDQDFVRPEPVCEARTRSFPFTGRWTWVFLIGFATFTLSKFACTLYFVKWISLIPLFMNYICTFALCKTSQTLQAKRGW